MEPIPFSAVIGTGLSKAGSNLVRRKTLALDFEFG
jgi:hypothetical protein